MQALPERLQIPRSLPHRSLFLEADGLASLHASDCEVGLLLLGRANNPPIPPAPLRPLLLPNLPPPIHKSNLIQLFLC